MPLLLLVLITQIVLTGVAHSQVFDTHELTSGPHAASGNLAGAIFSMPSCGDFDGDGELDIILTTLHRGEGVRFYKGSRTPEGGRIFEPGVDVDIPAAPKAVIDWNGDGLPDILALDKNEYDVRNSHDQIALYLCRGGAPPVFSYEGSLWKDHPERPGLDADYITAYRSGDSVSVVIGGNSFSHHWPQQNRPEDPGIGFWKGYDDTGRWRGAERLAFLERFQFSRSFNTAPAGPAILTGRFSPLAGHLSASPIAIDADTDGDRDILYANFVGNFFYAENVGSNASTQYEDPLTLLDTERTRLRAPQCMVRGQAIDWNTDGREDLLFGCEDGFVYFSLNQTEPGGLPRFSPPQAVLQKHPPLDCGVAAVPAAADLDADGDTDLIAGNASGEILLIWNQGSEAKPAFDMPARLQVEGRGFQRVAGYNGSIQGPGEARWGYLALSVADVDGDGDFDVLYSSASGYHSYLLNRGTIQEPVWSQPAPVLYEGRHYRTVWRTRPLVTDWNEDGANDYICLNERGELGIFPGSPGRRWCELAEWIPWKFEDGSAIDPDSENGMEGRAKIEIVDWNGDGQRDVLIGVKGGTPWADGQGKKKLSYVFFLRCLQDGNAAVFAPRRPIRLTDGEEIEVGDHTVSPEVVALFGDRTPGLLLGIENGRLNYYPKNALSW